MTTFGVQRMFQKAGRTTIGLKDSIGSFKFSIIIIFLAKNSLVVHI